MSTGQVRFGIIGTGKISESIVADMATIPDATTTAVWGRRIERARAFAAQYGISTATDDLAALLDRQDVDAVYIATPTGTHRRIALQAIEAGKHVLVEKPMAMSAADVDEIFDAARRAETFVMEAMWMRFNPMHVEVQRRLADGGLGKVRSVRAGFGMPFPAGGSRWSADLGGSTVLDQGIYPVTLALQALGDPASIDATGIVRDGVDVAAHITLGYDDGRFAHLACSIVEFIDPSASISGTEGWVEIDPMFWAGTTASWHGGDARAIFVEPERITPPKEGNGYTPMLRSVSAAIATGVQEHPVHDRVSTLRTTRVLESIRSSMGLGADSRDRSIEEGPSA